MKNTRYNGSAKELCEWEAWTQSQQEDNGDNIDRMRRNLRRARSTELTARQSELLRLHFDEGKSMRQIAREQGIGIGTVSRTIARAKKRLQHCLKYVL